MIKGGMAHDSYFVEETGDVRDSARFKAFTADVDAFIQESRSVTWRQLNERFDNRHYWLLMAVEKLDGRSVTWHKERMPERIEAK